MIAQQAVGCGERYKRRRDGHGEEFPGMGVRGLFCLAVTH
jgi:hypothetical protein